MKMTIKRRVKCTGCIHFPQEEDMAISDTECILPVPSYIPQEQHLWWMKMYHENQVKCPDHMSPKRLAKELFDLE